MTYRTLNLSDNKIFRYIKSEEKRQLTTLEMIASENFASNAVMLTKEADISDQSIKKGTINLNIESKESSILGVQFDIIYNSEELNLSKGNIISKSGIEVYSNIKEAGLARVLMFSMNLDRVSNANQLSDIIDFTVTPMSGVSNATITFDNIILAGENGQELDYPDTYVYDLNSDDLLPNTTELSNIYPNPFNPSTTIEYYLPNNTEISIAIYDLQGRQIASLINDVVSAGNHSIVWNANNYSSGIYFVKMVAGNFIETQKLVMVK